MHILESYALSAGCRIGKCFIHEEPIDLPDIKYITFHPYSDKGNSRKYDYWNEIIDKLQNNKNFSYSIVQTGNENDPTYPGIDTSYLGKTNYHSLAYLINYSSLHLGIDSFPLHLASHFKKKIVALYCHYSTISGPYFSDSKDIKIFQPNFDKIKPVFNYDDPFRLINNIDPCDVYDAVTQLIEISQ